MISSPQKVPMSPFPCLSALSGGSRYLTSTITDDGCICYLHINGSVQYVLFRARLQWSAWSVTCIRVCVAVDRSFCCLCC